MVLELLSELMLTTWGQVAAIGTSVAVLIVWAMWIWEATVADAAEKDEVDDIHFERPHVFRKLRTFEKPFHMPNLYEPTNFEVWVNIEFGIRGALSNLKTMIRETISDFVSWSKTNKMFYIGTLGFAGTYYGGMLVFTNPTIMSALKSVGTAPYMLVALMVGVVLWELSNNKEEDNGASVEV